MKYFNLTILLLLFTHKNICGQTNRNDTDSIIDKHYAKIELSKGKIEFDTLIQGQVAWDTVFISNIGDMDLLISNIGFQDGGSSVRSFSKLIRPKTIGYVVAGFPYEKTGHIYKSIQIHSNAVNGQINIPMHVYFTPK